MTDSGSPTNPTGTRPAPVTVLGLGPMGQALARAFLAAGHPTTVWNRTPGKAGPLVRSGACRAGNVAAAAGAGRLVVVCVLDYDAVRAILEPAAGALRGRTVLNLTADSPQRARELADWAAAHRIDYLDGAILSPIADIGGPRAVVLYSGPAAVYQTHRDTLASLGGTGTHVGEDPARAAAYDVSLLDLFWTTMSGTVHALALARAYQVPPTDLAPFAKGIAQLMPDIIDEFAAQVAAGEFPGDDSTLTSAAAGMDHIIHAAEEKGLDAGVLRAARAAAGRAIAAGHGEDSFARVAAMLRKPVAEPVRAP